MDSLLSLLAAAASILATGNAKPIVVGDPAPAISVKAFVKGQPVSTFEKGKIYVVEFWATWCGPCKMSIPHLTEMQKKFNDVTFIGVSVFEETQTGVDPFVKSMGDKMNYRVALDLIPEGKTGQDGIMAKTWMEASEQPGIPTAFVVNKDGNLAWIGHPMELEQPLARISSGKWNIKAESKDYVVKMAEKKAMMGLLTTIAPMLQSKDYPNALKLVDGEIEKRPKLEEMAGSVKLNILISSGDDTGACSYAEKLVSGVLKSNSPSLNEIAWMIANPDADKKPSAALLQVAINAAKRADRLMKGNDAGTTDTLATAYFAAGKKVLAIKTEQRAIAHCTDENLGKELKKNLEKFQK